jgi:hypothetical protein
MWISAGGPRPRPLNCVAIAWAMTDRHVEIAKLLIDHGAVVDETVLADHAAEMTGGDADQRLTQLLARCDSRRKP